MVRGYPLVLILYQSSDLHLGGDILIDDVHRTLGMLYLLVGLFAVNKDASAHPTTCE